MTAEMQARFEKWLESRPPVVRELARRYPPGTKFDRHGKTFHVIAYTDQGGLMVTEIDPAIDYAQALFSRRAICKCCLEELSRHLN